MARKWREVRAEAEGMGAIARRCTLTEFLLARIAEDERKFTDYIAKHREDDDYFPEHEWCARRELARCRADRSIIQACDYDGMTADYVLQCLGAVHADHPDYRAEWKP